MCPSTSSHASDRHCYLSVRRCALVCVCTFVQAAAVTAWRLYCRGLTLPAGVVCGNRKQCKMDLRVWTAADTEFYPKLTKISCDKRSFPSASPAGPQQELDSHTDWPARLASKPGWLQHKCTFLPAPLQAQASKSRPADCFRISIGLFCTPAPQQQQHPARTSRQIT